jgi:hypothetical protein
MKKLLTLTIISTLLLTGCLFSKNQDQEIIWENDLLQEIQTDTHIYYAYKDGRHLDQGNQFVPDPLNKKFNSKKAKKAPITTITPDEDYIIYMGQNDLMAFNILDGGTYSLMELPEKTEEFQWDKNELIFETSKEKYFLEINMGEIESTKIIKLNDSKMENLTYETPEQIEMTESPQDAVFYVALEWTGGPAGAPVLNLETGQPMEFEENDIYINSEGYDKIKESTKEQEFLPNHLKISANITLNPDASGTIALPPGPDGEIPTKDYTAVQINELYDVLAVNQWGDKPE